MTAIVGTPEGEGSDCCHRVGGAIIGHTAGNTHTAGIVVIIGVPIGDLDCPGTGVGDLVIDAILLKVVVGLLDVGETAPWRRRLISVVGLLRHKQRGTAIGRCTKVVGAGTGRSFSPHVDRRQPRAVLKHIVIYRRHSAGNDNACQFCATTEGLVQQHRQ